MNNFIEIVGLQDIVDKIPDNLKATNFEELYSNLHNDNPDSEFIKEIEKRVFAYFNSMELPNEPTVYDYLVLSLRAKDAIATFNWDPFYTKHGADVENIQTIYLLYFSSW